MHWTASFRGEWSGWNIITFFFFPRWIMIPDDWTIVTLFLQYVHTRWNFMTWIQIKFKPRKPRGTVPSKMEPWSAISRSMSRSKVIPSTDIIWYDASPADKIDKVQGQKKLIMEENSGITPPGKFKFWIFQCPATKIMWLLTIYEVPIISHTRILDKVGSAKLGSHMAWTCNWSPSTSLSFSSNQCMVFRQTSCTDGE